MHASREEGVSQSEWVRCLSKELTEIGNLVSSRAHAEHVLPSANQTRSTSLRSVVATKKSPPSASVHILLTSSTLIQERNLLGSANEVIPANSNACIEVDSAVGSTTSIIPTRCTKEVVALDIAVAAGRSKARCSKDAGDGWSDESNGEADGGELHCVVRSGGCGSD